MFGAVLTLHSLVRWLLLGAIAARLGRALVGVIQKAPPGPVDRRTSLILVILTDLQITLGLLLYAVSPNIRQALAAPGLAMKDSALRLILVEHPLTMVIAAALIHVAHVIGKRATAERPPHTKVLVLVLLAFVLMLSRIPW